MKLPGNRNFSGTFFNASFFPGYSLYRHKNIALQADMEACVRPGNLDGRPVQHCYLRLVDDAGVIADSVSYGPGETGGPDKKPGSPVQCTGVVKNISPASWNMVKDFYRRYSTSRPFVLGDHDCCSCAAKAIGLAGGIAPDYILTANKS